MINNLFLRSFCSDVAHGPQALLFGRDEVPPHHLLNIKAKTTQLSWFCRVLWSWSPNMCMTVTTVSLSTIKEQMSSPVSGSRSGFHSAVSLDLRTFTGLLSFGQICWLDRDRFGSCWGAHGLCTSASPTGCSYWWAVCPLPLQVSATSQTQVVLVLSGQGPLRSLWRSSSWKLSGLQRFGLPAQSSC